MYSANSLSLFYPFMISHQRASKKYKNTKFKLHYHVFLLSLNVNSNSCCTHIDLTARELNSDKTREILFIMHKLLLSPTSVFNKKSGTTVGGARTQ